MAVTGYQRPGPESILLTERPAADPRARMGPTLRAQHTRNPSWPTGQAPSGTRLTAFRSLAPCSPAASDSLCQGQLPGAGKMTTLRNDAARPRGPRGCLRAGNAAGTRKAPTSMSCGAVRTGIALRLSCFSASSCSGRVS